MCNLMLESGLMKPFIKSRVQEATFGKFVGLMKNTKLNPLLELVDFLFINTNI
jgi:hypothetical protein